MKSAFLKAVLPLTAMGLAPTMAQAEIVNSTEHTREYQGEMVTSFESEYQACSADGSVVTMTAYFSDKETEAKIDGLFTEVAGKYSDEVFATSERSEMFALDDFIDGLAEEGLLGGKHQKIKIGGHTGLSLTGEKCVVPDQPEETELPEVQIVTNMPGLSA